MPELHPQVTALFPVGPGTDVARLRRSFESMRDQTRPPALLLVVGNGLSAAEHSSVDQAAASVANPIPLRVLTLARANLAAALNLGMREAPTPLVARMDADDESLPDRLERQVAYLENHPGVDAVGCAWEVVSPDGTPRAVMRPETDPGRLSLSLLMGNTLAHGSMLLRIAGVLAGGGYDEQLDRAQDYDLWLRLRPRVGACPEVLYRYTEQTEPGVGASSDMQAEAAAAGMLRAWAELPESIPGQRDQLTPLIARALRQDHGGDVHARIETLLRGRESREALLALLWARDRFPSMRHRAIETCRRARVREVCGRIAQAGTTRLWLWGAGQHTRRLLEHPQDLGVGLAGVADDVAFGQERFGCKIVHPGKIPVGEHVLISSDLHEERMWAAGAPLRDRGVQLWRLYGGE